MNVADHTGVRVMAERCPTCIFRPGNLMHLQPGRVKNMLASARRNDSCIPCHSTLDDEFQAVCRGQYEVMQTTPLQIAERLGLIVEWTRPHPRARTGVHSHTPPSPPTRQPPQKGGRQPMTSATQSPIGPVTGLFASTQPDQFGQTVDELFSSARAISNAVVDEVEQDKITTTQGAAVIANVIGCLFGWPEFHRETRPSDLALMLAGQAGQVHGDGQ